MKKNIDHLKAFVPVFLFAFTLAFFLLNNSKAVMAQPVASITYNFSGYTIPAGASPLYTLDSNAMSALYIKNPDGTPTVDAAGNYLADTNAITGFISALAAKYDVPGVSILNQALEVNYLITAINAGLSDPSHTPSMTVADPVIIPAATPSYTDVTALLQTTGTSVPAPLTADTVSATAGSTYVDVNLTTQKLVYFVNGTPFIISDIVSGRSGSRSTPTGTFAVYAKQTGRTLKGPGYSAYVNFWMPFYKSYGLHDANWRSNFGGTIYQTGGSHGCVNMPYETAAALYNSINIGTPVIIHN